MICPNCKKENNIEADFCQDCGTSLKNNNIPSQEINKKNHSSKLPIIIIIVVIILIIGLSIVGINYFKNKIKNIIPNLNNTVEERKEKYSSVEKIKKDYESGKLNVNDYFKQLVYLEFDSSKLDKKYNSDYSTLISTEQLDTPNILDEKHEELDKDIVKFYLTNKLMKNVKLVDETSLKKQSNNNNKYKVTQLKDENDKNNASNHFLNKVKLSRNKNFLIWYTNTGDDAITEEQLNSIANGLEDSIIEYEKIFGVVFSYDPYVDNKYFNDDYDWAEEVLSINNLSTNVLKTAMSVYIYDTGSSSTAASYRDEEDAKKDINRSLIFDLMDEDGIINYPYIVINKQAIETNNESLVQLYNHELFHHFQYLYCMSTIEDRCPKNFVLTEGLANFASSRVSKVTGRNNFLNEWAGIYAQNTSNKLVEIVNYAGDGGYALFTYFDAYYNNIANSKEILMEAHTKNDAIKYISEKTEKEDLINTINELAYKTLSQDYDNSSLFSTQKINYKQELKEKNKYSLKINAGSIDYFELNNNSDIKISTNNNDFLTIKVYGYKNNIYKEIKSSNSLVELDTAFYSNYDKVYLVITNGDLLKSYDYIIDYTNSKVIENSEYDTTLNNYNIDIIMKTKIAGIEVTQHSKGVVDELHQKEYLDFDTTTMGMTLSNKIYYDFNSGYTYMTQPYGGDAWWKEKGTSQLVDLKSILNKLVNMKDVTKVSDNHYIVKMTKNDIKDMMKSAKSDTSAIKGNVSIDVYTDNGYIVKLEYDFSKLVSGFDLFTTTINFSNYNNAGDVEIPEVIVKNAKSM